MRLDLSFQLKKGSFQARFQALLEQPVTGIFGPSGSGKTTLLHMIAGLESCDSGRLALDGDVLYDAASGIHIPPHQRNIAVVFQESRLFPHLDVVGNLRFGMRATGQRFQCDEVVNWLALEALLDKTPAQLSGGERQRVALGRALLSSPRLLLLDEPLASLDRGLKLHIMPFLRRIRDKAGIPMLYVSHDLSELLQLTDQLLVLKEGRALAHGSFLELVQREAVLDLIHDLGLLNVIPAQAVKSLPDEGICYLQPECSTGSTTPPWTGPLVLSEQQRLYVTLRPEDVALIRDPVPGISIQNQIQGTIENLMISRHKALCVVDVGIRLLAEVTPHAIKELGLARGQTITCLFKAQALNYLP